MRASTLSLFISLVVSVHGLLALRPGVNVSQYVQLQPSLFVQKMWSAPTAIRLVHKGIGSLRAPGQLISVDESVHTTSTISSVASTPTSTAIASFTQIMCAIGFDFNAGARASFPPSNTTMAIEDFCANKIARASNPIHPKQFLQDKFKDTTTYPQRSYLCSDVTISIMAMFADTVGMSGLAGRGQDVEFVVKDRESVCRGILQQIVQECEDLMTSWL
ncbi:hypothetical protein E4T47_07033 [Aureobasidium subglaciale]|nr:hypothetical protein E4T47_07033 [Aureobasidium subglaciale]